MFTSRYWNLVFAEVKCFLLFTIYSLDFSTLGIYYSRNNRKTFVNKMLLQIHKYIKQRGNRGHKEGSHGHIIPGRGQHERPEGRVGRTLGGSSPYLASGSHRALAAPWAGHTFRQSKSKKFHLLETKRGISRNCALFTSSCSLKKTL